MKRDERMSYVAERQSPPQQFGAQPTRYANNPTVGELFDAYLKDRNNKHSYRKCKHPKSLEGHLMLPRKAWGDWRIEDFRVGSKARVKAEVMRWQEEMSHAIGTCRKRVSVMRTAFRFAVSDELIERGQEPVFEMPPNGAPRERFLSHDELITLLRTADKIHTPDHVLLALEVALRTGQRIGAIIALRWEHVDFENRVIRFRDTEAPDERSKKRRVNQPMDDELFDIMLAAKERATCDAVIEWRSKPVRSVYSGMKKLFARAGLSGVRVHDLRRTAATIVRREMDGSISAAAQLLGDTESITQKHYAQDAPETRIKQVNALSGALARARGR